MTTNDALIRLADRLDKSIIFLPNSGAMKELARVADELRILTSQPADPPLTEATVRQIAQEFLDAHREGAEAHIRATTRTSSNPHGHATPDPAPVVSDAEPVADHEAVRREWVYCRQQMKAVWDYLKPNESNDMEWADEIICAIEHRHEDGAVALAKALLDRIHEVGLTRKGEREGV